MKRPQPVTVPLVVLLALIPSYIFIGEAMPGRTVYQPELALDRAFSLRPAWSVVYGSLFLAALLPALVLHQQELVRRAILAYLAIWLASLALFVAYPTVTPRHEGFVADGFCAWILRFIYSSDVRYNCFPSLHVAQCVLAALACHRVHRGVGIATGVWAFLVALSTLYTKQHYVADAVAGALLAYVAHLMFLRGYPREATPEPERRLAPLLALAAFAVYGLLVAIVGIWYVLDGPAEASP